MLTELHQITAIVSNVCTITFTCWLFLKIWQIKKYFRLYMDIEKLIGGENLCVDIQDNKMKERLIQVVASGKSKFYLGKNFSTEEIESLDEKEITKLYGRYESALGGLITNTLKQHICLAYTRVVELACPTLSKNRYKLQDPVELMKHLNNGPFIDLALTSITCKLYHEYGHFLAPLEAAILTSNFIQSADQQIVQQNPTNDQQNPAS